MTPATLEKLVWVLIYGGILAFCLGWFVARTDAAFGLVLQVAGAVGAVLGVVLIWRRSRIGKP